METMSEYTFELPGHGTLCPNVYLLLGEHLRGLWVTQSIRDECRARTHPELEQRRKVETEPLYIALRPKELEEGRRVRIECVEPAGGVGDEGCAPVVLDDAHTIHVRIEQVR